MRCVRLGSPGAEIPGLLDTNNQLYDARPWVRDWAGETLAPAFLQKLAQRDITKLPRIAYPQRWGACIGAVGKIIGIALNYQKHAAETGSRPTTEPHLFLKATSALCGAEDPLLMPAFDTPAGHKLDWEVELGVVIGQHADNITAEAAPAFIAGYCLLNDVSERAFQLEHGGQQHTKGKSAASFCPIGPWLLTMLPDPQNIALWTEINGQRRQDGNTAQMIYGVHELIAYCSRFMTLEPGDIIATGTPDGVGRGMNPPHYLQIGDTVTMGGTGLGLQRHKVTAS